MLGRVRAPLDVSLIHSIRELYVHRKLMKSVEDRRRAVTTSCCILTLSGIWVSATKSRYTKLISTPAALWLSL